MEYYELYIDTDLQILVLVIGLISADLNLTILPSCGDLIISAFDGLFSLDEWLRTTAEITIADAILVRDCGAEQQ